MSGKLIKEKPNREEKFSSDKRIGNSIYISGTSSRRLDNSFEGVEVDEMGTTILDIKKQTRAVL